MQDFMKKLTSRKFLACIAGVIIGVCMIFGLDGNAIDRIIGAITSVSSVMIYIYAEGKIDAAAVDKIKDAVEKIEEVTDMVEKIEE